MADNEYDVVVAGSGAGGAAACWALTQAGARVLLLEAGPEYDPATDYRLDRNDWEAAGFPEKLPVEGRHTYAEMQALEDRWSGLRSWNRATGRTNPAARRWGGKYHHVVGLGGSTLHFTGEAHRIHPAAMRLATRHGVGADWPMDYAELEPLYLELERLIGVAGPARDPRRPRSGPYPLPAHPFSHASRKLADGFRALGLGCEANARAALSAPYDDRPGCNYCGGCALGCPRRDKGSADQTFLRHARATGRLAIRTMAPVLAIEAGPDDRIRGVVHALPGGGQARATAKAVVLACGAVETPRLLLASTGPGSTGGLANESGQVGRNFLESVSWTSVALHPEQLGSHRGLPADIICWDHNAPDGIPGIIGGCRFTNGTAEAGLLGPAAYARRLVPGFGTANAQGVRAIFGRALAVGAIGECLPNPGSFIDLDPDKRDAAGMPLARIHSHYDEMTLRRLDFMARTCRNVLAAAGARELVEEYGTYDMFSTAHVGGTCRMGADPAQSVVNATGRSHRWRNLFIADGSVLPTMGGGEAPSLSIAALAVRTGRAIAAGAARGEL